MTKPTTQEIIDIALNPPTMYDLVIQCELFTVDNTSVPQKIELKLLVDSDEEKLREIAAYISVSTSNSIKKFLAKHKAISAYMMDDPTSRITNPKVTVSIAAPLYTAHVEKQDA